MNRVQECQQKMNELLKEYNCYIALDLSATCACTNARVSLVSAGQTTAEHAQFIKLIDTEIDSHYYDGKQN